MKTNTLGIGRRRYFTDAELQRLWDAAKRRGILLQNGITASLLRERYRRPIYHKMGIGWFYYPASKRLPKADCELGSVWHYTQD